jgi:hypothetical protein
MLPSLPRDLEPSEDGSPLEITLKYEGVDVENGTMPVDDVVTALRGFSGAYGKLAAAQDPLGQHQIRVSAVTRSSFLVSILAFAKSNPAIVTAGTSVSIAVVTGLMKLINLKKATKGAPPSSLTVTGSNNSVIVNVGDNTTIEVPRPIYELYKTRALDSELNKIVSPLHEGRIDAVSLGAKGQDSVVITSSEKDFFTADGFVTTSSRPLALEGTLVSLNKENNRGRFRMQNGKTVPYHFSGSDSTRFYLEFGHRGLVVVECIATFDENLELKTLEITNAEKVQRDLFEELG